MTSHSARASLVAPRSRRIAQFAGSVAVPVAGLAVLSAECALPLLRDAAFGMLLCAWVAARFYRFNHGRAVRSGAELREFSRLCSRSVYLTLYASLLVQLLCRMLCHTDRGAGFALGWSLPFQAAPPSVIMQCGEAFRGRLLGGVIALLLIRGLAYQFRRGADSDSMMA